MASSVEPVLHPRGASFGCPPSCWGSPSKVDEFELVGCTKSHEERSARGQERAVSAQWVRDDEQRCAEVSSGCGGGAWWVRKAAIAD